MDIETRKVDVGSGSSGHLPQKVDIITHTVAGESDRSCCSDAYPSIYFEKFGYDKIFGRSAIMDTLELKSSGASKLISNLFTS